MKRIILHISFWLVYLAQDTLLAYSWNASKLKVSSAEQAWLSFQHCAVILVPKLLFTYFILYVVLKSMLKGTVKMWKNILLLFVSLTITLYLERAITVFLVYPYIYDGMMGTLRYWNPSGLLVALMDLGFASGTAIFIKQVRLQLAGKEKEKLLVKQKLETELKFLKNQTHPHFLFNTLNNIYALARKGSPDTAEAVMKLSELLRFMLYESNGNFIPLSDEIKILGDYLELEKMRYNARLSVQFAKEVDEGNYQITPLLLLPFVENAFKHGVSETRFESFIRIDMKVLKGHLTFIIENSKEADIPAAGSNSIGLNNVKRQLELVYTDYQLDVQDKEKTYKVTLSMNLNNYAAI